MTMCGWCKTSGLTLVRLSEVDEESGEIVKTRDAVLRPHAVRGTVSRQCRGFETYRDTGSDGTTSRSK